MKIIKSFSIFKNKPSDNEKVPTHSLSAKIGDSYVNIGSCWTKDGKNGKFLSAQLAKVYVDHSNNTKSRKAVVMCFEEDLIKLCQVAGEDYVVDDSIPSQKPKIDASHDVVGF